MGTRLSLEDFKRSVIRGLSRSIIALLINVAVILYTINVYSEPVKLPLTTRFQELQQGIIGFFIFIISYVFLVIFHVVMFYAFTADLGASLLNRFLSFLFVFNFVAGLSGQYVISLLILEVIGIICTVFFFSFYFKIYPQRGESKRVVGGFIARLRRSTSWLSINLVPVVLASHSLSASIFVISLLLIHNRALSGVELDLGPTLLILVVPPLAVLLMTLRSSLNNYLDALVTGILSGVGLLGLVPLAIHSTFSLGEVITLPSKVFYTEKRGVYLGRSEIVITCEEIAEESGEEVAKGVHRGVCSWNKISRDVFVDINELNTPHIVIVGASGTGKTVLTKHLIREFVKNYGYKFIVIDVHGEYRDLASVVDCHIIDASEQALNPLYLGNSSPRERALQLSQALAAIFKLGFLQTQMLEEIIMQTYESKNILNSDPSTWTREPPTLLDLAATCEAISKERAEFQRVLPYLELLKDHLSGMNWLSISELLEGNVIIDLSKLPSDFAKALYLDTLIYYLVNEMYKRRGAKKLQIVFEEARSFMPRQLTRELLQRLFTESRKFGYSIVVVTQDIGGVPYMLVNNAGLRIFFLLNDPKSIEEASKIIGGVSKARRELIAKMLRTIQPHTFIAHATGVSEVLVIKTPQFSVVS